MNWFVNARDVNLYYRRGSSHLIKYFRDEKKIIPSKSISSSVRGNKDESERLRNQESKICKCDGKALHLS